MKEIIIKKTIAVYGSHKVFTDTVKLEKYNNNLCLTNGFIRNTKRYITNKGIEFIYIAHPSDAAGVRIDDYHTNTPYKNKGIPTTSEMEIIRFLRLRLK